jgi:hypothetical protein
MADPLAARARCAEFLKNHTRDVCPDELPALEECPICLDTYQNEKPVQIQVEGCNHILGRWCLEAMLTTNPRLEKTCPLCRTKLMDAPAGSPAGPAVGLPPGRAIPMPSLRSARPPDLTPASGAQDSVRSRRQPPRGTSLFSSNNNPSGASFQPRIFNLIDPDDDEDVSISKAFCLCCPSANLLCSPCIASTRSHATSMMFGSERALVGCPASSVSRTRNRRVPHRCLVDHFYPSRRIPPLTSRASRASKDNKDNKDNKDSKDSQRHLQALSLMRPAVSRYRMICFCQIGLLQPPLKA